MAEWKSSELDRKTTPEQWNQTKTPNDESAAGKNLNYWAFKDRSGNVLKTIHEKGYENVTVEHNSGAKLEFLPDGAVHLKAQKGRYTMIFGEDRIEVTGANDITIKGDASLKVEGKYNLTVSKEANFTVEGDFNLKAKNTNIMTGCFDVGAKNQTTKVEGSITVTAQEGIDMTAEKAFGLGSTSDTVGIGASKDVGIYAKNGKMMLESKGKMSMYSNSNDVAIKSETGQVGIKSKADTKIKADAKIHLNSSGTPTAPDKASTETKAVKPEKIDCPKDSETGQDNRTISV